MALGQRSGKGRLRRSDCGPANNRCRRVSLVAAYPGDRLLSEPTAGTQPYEGGTALHAPKRKSTARLDRQTT